jgi:nicotinamide-nucleotide amidase
MRVVMVSIGDELLDGRIADGNLQTAGRFLGERGLKLLGHWTVADDVEAIEQAVRGAARGAALVLVTGGLGPTADDVTREALARAAGVGLERDEEAAQRMAARFVARGAVMTANNAQQTMFPAGSRVLQSEVGTAASFLVEVDGAKVVSMPGVPREFAWFLETYVAGVLEELGASVAGWHKAALQYFGVGESQLEAELDGIEPIARRVGGRVGYRAAYPELYVTLSAPSAAGLAELVEHAQARASRWEVGRDGVWLVERLGRLLVARGETVTTAESCTAGGIARALTEIGGSSAWIERAWVTYANAAKVELVGVREEMLKAHGAVSEEVVCQMAAGARERAGASWGLAVSGVAGPGGGSEAKPVGTVHMAWSSEAGVWHHRAQFGGRDRSGVREATVYTALAVLLWMLEGKDVSWLGVSGPRAEQEVWR